MILVNKNFYQYLLHKEIIKIWYQINYPRFILSKKYLVELQYNSSPGSNLFSFDYTCGSYYSADFDKQFGANGQF